MAGKVKVDDAGRLAEIGARMRAMAEDFGIEALRIRREIEQIDAKRPWGDDVPGQKIQRMYTRPIGGGAGFSEALKDELTGAGEPLAGLGDLVIQQMVAYDRGEAANRQDLSKPFARRSERG